VKGSSATTCGASHKQGKRHQEY